LVKALIRIGWIRIAFFTGTKVSGTVGEMVPAEIVLEIVPCEKDVREVAIARIRSNCFIFYFIL
jgi:hypothetical protein